MPADCRVYALIMADASPLRITTTFWLGVAIIFTSEVMLFVDVAARGGDRSPFPPGYELPAIESAWDYAARWFAVNMTGLCWIGFLLVFDGVLTMRATRFGDASLSPIRSRPNRFLAIWLTSIPVWCVFDGVNFYLMHAWTYHGLPPEFRQRVVGYFVAFAAISPGMFLAAEWFQQIGVKRWRTTGIAFNRKAAGSLTGGVVGLIVAATLLILWLNPEGTAAAHAHVGLAWSAALLILPGVIAAIVTRHLMWTSLVVGAACTAWALLVRDAVGNMTLWIGLIFLLDPIVAKLGGVSVLRDWQRGRWGRTASLMLGGAVCGLCWEFWNFWALAKWSYDLPFVGWLEGYRYFEMPLIGFQGFLPFAVECWVMFNLIDAVLRKMGVRIAERLPTRDAVM